jgi:hypothetical protein
MLLSSNRLPITSPEEECKNNDRQREPEQPRRTTVLNLAFTNRRMFLSSATRMNPVTLHDFFSLSFELFVRFFRFDCQSQTGAREKHLVCQRAEAVTPLC